MEKKEIKKQINEVIKNIVIKENISKKTKNKYKAVEIELTNSYKESIFLTQSLGQMIDILSPGAPEKAIKKLEVLDKVSADGKAYRVCNVVLTNDYDEALFLTRPLNKLIDILIN